MMTIAAVFGAITQAGLVPRGALRLEERERLGALAEIRTISLAGFVGRGGWDALAKSPEAADGAAHPLDRWSERVIGRLARELGAKALFPFGGRVFDRPADERGGETGVLMVGMPRAAGELAGAKHALAEIDVSRIQGRGSSCPCAERPWRRGAFCA